MYIHQGCECGRMTHEPECTYRTEQAIMSDIVVSPCICSNLRAAGERYYQRGREAAARAFLSALGEGTFDDAIAAARGESAE